MTIHNIDHIYILCDKSYELNRYNFLLKWAQDNFHPSYFSFNMYCYKDTIHKKDIVKYGLVENRLKPSEMSLFINYMKIFEDIVDKYSNNKNSHFLILESDVIAQTDWKNIISSQMKLLEGKEFDFLHVGNGGNNDFLPSLFGHHITNNYNVYPCPSARCTEAMIWSYNGARKYLSYKHKPVIHPLDFYFNTIAANGIKNLEETKSFWGHPVAFIQGTANGTYESTVNDCIKLPERLSFYNKQINIHIDKDLFYFEDIIKHILKKSFPETHVTNYPNRKPQLIVTSKPSQTYPYILIHTKTNKCNETNNKNDNLRIVELCLYETFDKGVFHIPEVCLSPLVWELDKLTYRFLNDTKSLTIYNPRKQNTNDYIVNQINTLTPSMNSLFRLCVEDEYHPGFLTNQILEAYFDGCIPVVQSCNILLDKLFDESTYINLTKFKNDNQTIKYIKHCIDNKELLTLFFKKNPIKQKTILTWALDPDNNSLDNICKAFSLKFNPFYSNYIKQLEIIKTKQN